MNAKINSLHSLQLEDRLINYWPDDVSNFVHGVELTSVHKATRVGGI